MTEDSQPRVVADAAKHESTEQITIGRKFREVTSSESGSSEA